VAPALTLLSRKWKFIKWSKISIKFESIVSSISSVQYRKLKIWMGKVRKLFKLVPFLINFSCWTGPGAAFRFGSCSGSTSLLYTVRGIRTDDCELSRNFWTLMGTPHYSAFPRCGVTIGCN
jgi:hypothetical protein